MLDEKDLQAIAQLMHNETEPLRREISTIYQQLNELKESTATKGELQQSICDLKEAMATKDDLQQSICDLKEAMATKDDLQQSKHESVVLMEAYFDPKFNILADGIAAIREKLEAVDDIGEFKERVEVLEMVVKKHSRDIEQLKRAQ